jgi:hypothetical protein
MFLFTSQSNKSNMFLNFFQDTKRSAPVANTAVHIWKVLGSNIGLKTNYSEFFFCGFPQSLQENVRIAP